MARDWVKIHAFKKCHRIIVTILIIQGSFDVNETNTHTHTQRQGYCVMGKRKEGAW